MKHSKFFLGLLLSTTALLAREASASEYSHEPIHVICSEVHSIAILQAGINPAVGFFGMTLPNNREINIFHNIHSPFLQNSKVEVDVMKYDYGGIKSLKIVGSEKHWGYDYPATRRPPHYVGSSILTLELVNKTGGSLDIVEASLTHTNAKDEVVKKEVFDFTKYRLPGCYVEGI